MMINVKDYEMKFKVAKHKKGRGKKAKEYCDNIITLDFETTSYYIHKNKAITFDYKKDAEFYKNETIPQSVMYIWMVGIDKEVIYGRTFNELKEFMYRLNKYVGLDIQKTCYIHNLSFDFQFLRNAFGSNCDLFARKKRKPMKAFYQEINTEFRCSYFLTNKPLVKAIKDANAPIEKLVGALNYNVIRTPYTKLTELELKYCENDILGLYYVIEEKIKKYGHILDIPLTQTGQVRKAFKKAMWNEKKYIKDVSNMWPDFKQFKLLSEAYYGGYTHANHKLSNIIHESVYSYDITSSYPYVLCTQKFPIKKFSESYEKDLKFLDFDNYAYIADITFFNLKCTKDNTFLSVHKALKYDYDGSVIKKDKSRKKDKEIINENIVKDNGRLREADKARYILTDCDLMILNQCYTFDYRINTIYTAKKEYLPKRLIEFILDLFAKKTEYKDLEGFESKYKEAKEFINSIYGMFVTKILADEITFENGEWDEEELTEEEKANEVLAELAEKKQFCSYSTGVWCAAFARKHLWDVILKMDKDVIYCDTDSIKFLNKDNLKFFNEDNKNVLREIANVCIERDIDPKLFKAVAPNGELAKLGYYEEDGYYAQFITLGAKKYAYIKDGETEVNITVAGVNKKTGKKYFKDLDWFRPGAFLNYEYAGKNMVKYNDKQQPFTFEDGYTANELYGVVLIPTTYLLNVTSDYALLLQEQAYNGNDRVGIGATILN